MPSPPINIFQWATDNAYSDPGHPWNLKHTKLAPPGTSGPVATGEFATGFFPQTYVPSQIMNYLLNQIGQWINYLNGNLGGAMFGDGHHGVILADGADANILNVASYNGTDTYKLFKDVFATDFTIASGFLLNTNGYRIYCTGTFDTTANVATVCVFNYGNDAPFPPLGGPAIGGTAADHGGTLGGGVPGADGVTALGSGGGHGTAGVVGFNTNQSRGGNGGNGGDNNGHANAGGIGGSAVASSNPNGGAPHEYTPSTFGYTVGGARSGSYPTNSSDNYLCTLLPLEGGAGGGSGAAYDFGGGGTSATSGGGGGGAGVIAIAAANLNLDSDVNFDLQGGGGASAHCDAGANIGAGGGGGGGGGALILCYVNSTVTVFNAAVVCTGGPGGNGFGGGFNGANGADGTVTLVPLLGFVNSSVSAVEEEGVVDFTTSDPFKAVTFSQAFSVPYVPLVSIIMPNTTAGAPGLSIRNLTSTGFEIWPDAVFTGKASWRVRQ